MYVGLTWSKQAINSCKSDFRVIGISLISLRYDDKNLIPLSMQIRYFFGKKFSCHTSASDEPFGTFHRFEIEIDSD